MIEPDSEVQRGECGCERKREAVLALFAAVFVVLSLLTVFAIELSDTQAKSKNDVKSRVHERAALAAALIDSLFQSVQQGFRRMWQATERAM